MGQNKMEKDFRNKLNLREIEPRANAWDRLDAMLTVAEEKKPKRNYGWMYIAAGILGFLFVGTIFFTQTEEMIDVRRNNVVLENNEKPSKNDSANKTEISPKTASETIAAVTETKIKSNHHNQSQIGNSIKTVQELNQNPGLIANSNPTPENHQKNGSIINQKSEQQVTPAKVDELLAAVTPTPNTAVKSVKVNAKSLLSQVDGEINLTFREKILRKVGKNYQEVADAVSNRNTQQ
jgi:hypothetical protein